MEQNYPNPFNTTTTIEFSLPKKSKVLIQIYNVLGERIAVIFNNRLLEAGYHKITWDGKYENGCYAPSGIYFCKLRVAGKHEKINKLVLIR